MHRWAAVAALVAGLSAAGTDNPTASAAHVCGPYWQWSDGLDNSWQFSLCSGLVTVVRSGGPWGPCTRTYPPGSRWTKPEDVCGYHGPI